MSKGNEQSGNWGITVDAPPRMCAVCGKATSQNSIQTAKGWVSSPDYYLDSVVLKNGRLVNPGIAYHYACQPRVTPEDKQ